MRMQVPPALCTKAGKHLNKGKIYISKTSPPSVLKAYLSQFQTDFFAFLRSRAAEMVAGGGMLLSFNGRSSPDAAAEVGFHQWELLSQALMKKIDSFNAPYYAPSAEEVANIVEEEGSFIINHLQEFEIDWDGGSTDNNDDDNNNNVVNGFENLSRGRRVAKIVRAVVEPMVESHFGRDIMDELFRRYGEVVDHYMSKTRAKNINLILSVTRINSCY
ncbi:Jasmonate O-methyltransferase [Sesamum alatum]|uniref:Jasmonate O-methyltransferase n=1 Tax=Sesamum alatum TaxID=300844 RepID=A0AAE1YFM0_9LAMI|nr:Jasmonate O-methyltransferase [Sesamum alatum]